MVRVNSSLIEDMSADGDSGKSLYGRSEINTASHIGCSCHGCVSGLVARLL